MRITYNSPVILTFTILALVVRLADTLSGGSLLLNYFVLPGRSGFDFTSLTDYFRLFSYVLGHKDWFHLAGNFYLILLIGPILEEKYGSARLLFMMVITTLITAGLNLLLFSTGLTGASGIVFMLILLTPFAGAKAGTIPLTFILIAILYLAQEFFNILRHDQVSQFAHIAGGLVGSIFGFLASQSGVAANATTASSASKTKTTDDWLRELGDTSLQSKS